MKKKMTNQEKTFLAIVIPVLLLFFAFNTLPMLKGVVYSFTNYRGYGSYENVGLRKIGRASCRERVYEAV